MAINKMVAVIQLGFLLSLTPYASAGMTSMLLRAVGRANALVEHDSSKDASEETLNMFDTNKDGRVDPSEVSAFASNEGLDPESVTEDFSGLDSNGDGVLDSSELLQVLGGEPTNISGAGNAAPLNKQPAEKPVPPHHLQPQFVIKGLAADNPAAAKPALHGPKMSIQQPRHAVVPAAKQEGQVPNVEEQMAQSVQSSGAKQAVQSQPLPEAGKPTPVDRMVKHFAQVLRNADVLPIHEDTVKLAKGFVTPAAGYTAGDFTRVTVESAAKEVAEQLFIAETAEARARVLDRKAAEGRANATVLAKLTMQEALNAGATAAHAKANELLAKIAKLEDQAERAQVRSAALHSKAKLETEEASELMEVADRALNHVPAGAKSKQVVMAPV
jgi:hypothetical protein